MYMIYYQYKSKYNDVSVTRTLTHHIAYHKYNMLKLSK